MFKDFEQAYERIFSYVLQLNRHTSKIHGIEHWKSVEKNGVFLSSFNGANVSVVRLFAILHDSCRRDDGGDPEHGERAARMILRMKHQIPLNDDEMVLLLSACAWHNGGLVNKRDITIGTCWDADRLDLVRDGVNVVPREKMLSTKAAKDILEDFILSTYKTPTPLG